MSAPGTPESLSFIICTIVEFATARLCRLLIVLLAADTFKAPTEYVADVKGKPPIWQLLELPLFAVADSQQFTVTIFPILIYVACVTLATVS